MDDNPLLTTEQALELAKVSRRTLQYWIAHDLLHPEPFRVRARMMRGIRWSELQPLCPSGTELPK